LKEIIKAMEALMEEQNRSSFT